MIKVTVCIGSSCHLKGSRQVVEAFERMIKERKLSAFLDLNGTFCIGKCSATGVSVLVDDIFYSVDPEKTEEFFDEVIVKELNKS